MIRPSGPSDPSSRSGVGADAGAGRRSGVAGVVDALERTRFGWVATLIGLALVVLPDADWRIPDEHGVPYPAAFAASAVVAILALTLVTRRSAARWPSPFETLAAFVAVGVVLGALTVAWSQPLRDLGVYLHAGDAWRRGAPVYLDHLLTAPPADRSQYPFLYPPPVLVAFGIVGALPGPAVIAAFELASVALVVAALRVFGLGWRWVVAALLWRPVLEGLWVGNVAVPLVACLAFAPRVPAALALPPLAKAYSGVTTLWLVRDRRWTALGAAILVVGAIVVVTLPFAGLDRWREWVAGLDWFARSQPLVRDYLYGIALQRWLAPAVAIAIGVAVLALALVPRGVEGLARLGLAAPVLSPSVFVHGLLVAVPALLDLRPAVLWIALAAMSFGPSAWWWVGPGLAVASWAVPSLRREATSGSRTAQGAAIPDPRDPSVSWGGARAGVQREPKRRPGEP